MDKWKKIFERADGKARLHIGERDDGLFAFGIEEELVITDDDGTGNPGPYTFWIPKGASGLYQTAEEAEVAARLEVLWLSDAAEKSN